MKLRVLTPTTVVIDREVTKVIAEAEDGLFCLEPRHVDFVTALAPGILAFRPEGEDRDSYLAVDGGILVKCGEEVLVSSRRATTEAPLAELERVIIERYRRIDEGERIARTAIARLEAGAIRRFVEIGDSNG